MFSDFYTRSEGGLPETRETLPTEPWASYRISKIAGWACAGNAGKVFPRRRIQGKRQVSDPGMHHGTCVTHVPWCMSGSLIRSGGENVSGVPRACVIHNFTYLARGLWNIRRIADQNLPSSPIPLRNFSWNPNSMKYPSSTRTGVITTIFFAQIYVWAQCQWKI